MNIKASSLYISTAAILCIGTLFFLFTSSESADTEIDIADSSSYMENYNVYALQLPDYIDFAYEPAPVDRWYVKEALDRELLVNTYWQSQTLLLIKRANRYFPLIEPILQEQGVPDDFKYLALIESGFIPTAKSPAGASGIWQFMKATAIQHGLEVNSEVDERYNIEKSTRAACRYLKTAYNKFGNWTLAAASYNAGMGGVNKQLNRQDASNYYDVLFNPETGRYVYRILALKTILQNPQKYGFKYRPEDLYQPIPTYKVEVTGKIESLATFAKQYGINYPALKNLNPWLRDAFLTNKSGKAYYITLPERGYTHIEASSYSN